MPKIPLHNIFKGLGIENIVLENEEDVKQFKAQLLELAERLRLQEQLEEEVNEDPMESEEELAEEKADIVEDENKPPYGLTEEEFNAKPSEEDEMESMMEGQIPFQNDLGGPRE